MTVCCAGAPVSPPTPCHRLDRETSGLVLFARGRRARSILQSQFEEVKRRAGITADVAFYTDETVDAVLSPYDGLSIGIIVIVSWSARVRRSVSESGARTYQLTRSASDMLAVDSSPCI